MSDRCRRSRYRRSRYRRWHRDCRCALIQFAEQLVDLYNVAFAAQSLRKHSGLECRYLHGDLVGFKFHERIAGSDGIALLAQPA